MGDMTSREELQRLVLRQLAHGEFAKRFAPIGADGSRPIVVGLATDSLSDLGRRVREVGGAANVVTTLLDGLIVFQMQPAPDVVVPHPSNTLDPGCTVGVFVQRLIGDGGQLVFQIGGASASTPRILPVAVGA